MARFLGRLILVPLGFVLAAMATAAVFFTLGLERLTHAVASADMQHDGVDMFFSFAAGAVGIAGAATIIPALAIIIIGEVSRIRSFSYYVAGGGIAMAVMPLMAAVGSFGLGSSGNLGSTWPVFATAGFAGGFLYWLVAGRTA
ncbi:MAG: hypothetical protein ACK5JT_17385 [Hyphomicrobiaceae bacterium]